MQGLSMVFLGWLFAIGLGISGMTNVNKVTGFLNLQGDWDPSLLGVMGGGIGVYALGLFIVRKIRKRPIFGSKFMIPTRSDINLPLIAGAALFGAGWGLTGICPGPGLVSITSGAQTSIIFVAALLTSMFIFRQALYFISVKNK